jgi:peptidyl-prolyl cis-trans isomerase D
VSDAEIAKTIKADRMFAGPAGAFEQTRLDEILRDNGYTEASYVREQRESLLRQEIAGAVNGAFRTPNVLLSALNTFSNETRKAEYFILPAPDVSQAPPPADDAVKSFYEMRRDAYRTPEYRKVNVLIASPAEIAKTLAVSDEAAKSLYDKTAAERFSTPEKRDVSLLSFTAKDAAEKAASRIASGESFDAVAKDSGGVSADLGVTTKPAMFDKAVAEAAFALPQPGVTAPAQGQFGWVLARVAKIEPGSVKRFDEVKDQIKTELAQNQAKGEAQKLHDRIEDLRSQGKTLAQAAETVGLQTQTTVTDAAGAAKGENGQAGAPIPALAAAPELLKAIFASDVGVDNDSVSRKDGGFSWFEISAVEPPRQLPLDEVKAAVTKSLQEGTAQRDLAAKANELARKIEAGTGVAEAAAANGAQVQTAEDVRRAGAPNLSEAAAIQIFGTPVGGAGVAIAGQGGRMVFKVTGAATPPLDPKDPALAKILPQLQASVADDMFGQYISGLENQLGTKINQTALRAATGSEQ